MSLTQTTWWSVCLVFLWIKKKPLVLSRVLKQSMLLQKRLKEFSLTTTSRCWVGHVWSRLHNRQITLSGLSGSVVLIARVCSYMRYTCVLVGSPKYVQWINPLYLTQSRTAEQETTLISLQSTSPPLQPSHIYFLTPGTSPPFLFCFVLFYMYSQSEICFNGK